MGGERATELAKEQAAESVEPKYSIVALRNERWSTRSSPAWNSSTRTQMYRFDNKVEIYRREIPARYDAFVDKFAADNRDSETYNPGLLEEMARNVKEQRYTIPRRRLKLPLLSGQRLQGIRQVAAEAVRRLMYEQLTDAETARAKVAEMINTSSLDDRTDREIVPELARFAIMPNKFYDQQATEKARAQARENTPSVVIKEGDIVVRKGQTITRKSMNGWKVWGCCKSSTNIWPYFGLCHFRATVGAGNLQLPGAVGLPGNGPNAKYGNCSCSCCCMIFVAESAGDGDRGADPDVGHLLPRLSGACRARTGADRALARPRSRDRSAIVFAAAGSILFNTESGRIFDFTFGFVILVASLAAVFAVHKAGQRSTLLKAGVLASLFGTAAVLALISFGELPPRWRSSIRPPARSPAGCSPSCSSLA